jgi:hypothetical protein
MASPAPGPPDSYAYLGDENAPPRAAFVWPFPSSGRSRRSRGRSRRSIAQHLLPFNSP